MGKYYKRIFQSVGAFGLAFSSNVYDKLLNVFDFETSSVCSDVPIDSLQMYIEMKNVTQDVMSYNIFPTMILPDYQVRGIHELNFIKERTLIQDPMFFSKYWDLRFSPSAITLNESSTDYQRVLGLFESMKIQTNDDYTVYANALV